MNRLGGEFMPPLDEGDLLYMPSALPGLSAGKAAELLQQTDRLIKTVPEVASVFGKAGRAETATDPAPLEMFETTIQLKPREQWRPGMTPDKLVDELDRIVKVPGLSNIWVPPIRNRIDMLATGIKSPVGVKVAGTNLKEIDRIAAEIERTVKDVPGVSSALAERLTGGRYIDVNIDRDAAARYGLNVADVHSVITAAIGGDNIGETIEGLQRFPINVRYPREMRDSVEKIRTLPLLTERGAQIRLGDVAEVKVSDGSTGNQNLYDGWLATTNYAANFLIFHTGGAKYPASISDGTSNTILIAESAGRPTVYRRGVAVGDPQGNPPVRVNGGGWARAASDFDLKGSSTDGSAFPGPCAINCTNGKDVGNTYPDPVFGTNGTGETYAFHAQGANILFGDGSVRFVRQDIDVVTYAALVTRAGGESIASDF